MRSENEVYPLFTKRAGLKNSLICTRECARKEKYNIEKGFLIKIWGKVPIFNTLMNGILNAHSDNAFTFSAYSVVFFNLL